MRFMETLNTKNVQDAPLFQVADSLEAASSALLEDPIALLLQAHKTLGPVFKMVLSGQEQIVLAGMQANDFVWRNPRMVSYRVSNKPFEEQMGHDHLTALDGDHHKVKKKILKPAFSTGGAMRFIDSFNAMLSEKMSTLTPDEPVELNEFWARSIIEIHSKTVAQKTLSSEIIEKLSEWESQFLTGLVMGEERHAYFARPEYVELKKEVFALFHEIVNERLDTSCDIEDNLTEVIATRREVEGDDINRDNLVNDLYFILLAGVHNTAALLNSCLHYVYANPAWLAELREELQVWDGVSVRALSEMSKLKATIMESQRLYPPVVFQKKHVVEAFDFEGYHIPEGTNFFHANVLGHFLEENYEDPLTFKPQRFVESGKFVPKSFGFFGGGIHTCLGQNHSLIQTTVGLAQTITRFDLEFLYEPPLMVKLANPRRLAKTEYMTKFHPVGS